MNTLLNMIGSTCTLTRFLIGFGHFWMLHCAIDQQHPTCQWMTVYKKFFSLGIVCILCLSSCTDILLGFPFVYLLAIHHCTNYIFHQVFLITCFLMLWEGTFDLRNIMPNSNTCSNAKVNGNTLLIGIVVIFVFRKKKKKNNSYVLPSMK